MLFPVDRLGELISADWAHFFLIYIFKGYFLHFFMLLIPYIEKIIYGKKKNFQPPD